jgi:predicted nucleic-acid-binding Zn-ribbon protein
MAGIIIKGKDWSREEDAEKKQGKTDKIRELVGQVGKPLGKIYPGRIRSLLRGETPVVKIGYSQNTSVSRVDGETWTDVDGKTWKKENGFVTRIDNEDVLNLMVDVRKYLALPSVCPKCGNIFKDTPLNRKFWSLDKQCFNCSAEDHTRMKIAGTWTKFEETKLLENEKYYLIDVLGMIKDTIKTELKTVYQYINEDGTIEKWDNPSYKEQSEFFENEIKDIEKRLEEIEKALKELGDSK